MPGILEYWIFIEGDSIPEERILIQHLVKARAIDGSNMLIFTHIGMHMAMVSRTKNPHLFHPDLYEDDTVSDRLLPLAAARAPSMVILRFLSNSPVTEQGYLTFMPHLAQAIGELSGGIAVYDLGQKRLFSFSEFRDNVGKGKEASRWDAHVRVQWSPLPFMHAETMGMQKEGLPNLETGPMEADERMLVMHLLQEAASTVWKERKIPEFLMIDYFGSQFKIIFESMKGNREERKALVTLLRVEKH